MKSAFVVCAVLLLGAAAGPLACGGTSDDGGGPAAADPDAGAVSLGPSPYVDGSLPDGDKLVVDGGFEGPDGSVLPADRFVTKVVSFTPGDCAGYGAAKMPGVVLGPPVGAGSSAGSTDVVSLGFKGEIVLSFDPNAIVDGPGVDFIVFENAFWAGGNPSAPAAELGDVSVSDDGVTWKTFPCDPTSGPPYGSCAGWRPVYSAPGNGVSPVDPKTAGGDPYDLADLGVTGARYVRIRDLGTVPCPTDPAQKLTTDGFDLDAIAIVHGKLP